MGCHAEAGQYTEVASGLSAPSPGTGDLCWSSDSPERMERGEAGGVSAQPGPFPVVASAAS